MGSLPNGRQLNIESVAIIGAGSSGLAAAKYLLAERAFSRIVIFEQRSKVGGLWNHVPLGPKDEESLPVPQTSPDAGLDQRTQGGTDGSPQSFISPMYDRLEANIPRNLMRYSDLEWPEECPLYPRHEQALEYIRRYGQDVEHLIESSTQVLDVRLDEDHKWQVKTQLLSSSNGEITEHTFDAVLIANGHFNVPFIPSVPGIEAWHDAFPGSILHSKLYRRPEDYAGKKVIVVGNSASGTDIAAQIAKVCAQPLLVSTIAKSPYGPPDESSGMVEKPAIEEFDAVDRTVRFTDGTCESEIDAIVYCTGYFYSYPFLKSLDPPVIGTGRYVQNTYQHVFYRPQPSLAFLVLNQAIVPFPFAEAQSAVVARVWSGRVQLPGEAEMETWEKRTEEESGGGAWFHVLLYPKDANYINFMHDWAATADQQHIEHATNGSAQASDKATVGKTPPYWGEKECWTRENFVFIKKAYQGLGEERHTKRTLEDVGFDFAAYKKEKEEEDKKLSC
ncbi:hypothetical protein BDY17DRAFT_322589 [Neohortaea acidophila]|uniref:Uncharacterized protein n=1 Tax=Neohortaea acidophila TaxID=245834 RepID=A0A6A6Q2W8_9PEZI|nr:uncharacterized protein BDY17DRAFT_322589 [Neohortaea acidophila]KAF2485777.1 hypothetical protein BDY17DRAFT_322589 [Neohortaea acidophila]